MIVRFSHSYYGFLTLTFSFLWFCSYYCSFSVRDWRVETKVRTFRRKYLAIHLRYVRRIRGQLIVRASTKGIGIATETTSTEGDSEVKISKYLLSPPIEIDDERVWRVS
jgi:hypothetical protein